MGRIIFKKGSQRKFLREVLVRISCPSLRELRKRGFDVSYSSLKSYFVERRSLPEDLFFDLLRISGINKEALDFEVVGNNYGQVEGGKKGKRKN